VENVMTSTNSGQNVTTITGPALGDNLHLKNINGCTIQLSGCRGGVVNGLINASITVNGCSALKIMGVHYEGQNSITIKDSDVDIDGLFSYRNAIASSVVIQNTSSTDMRTVSIKNAQFIDNIVDLTTPGIYNFDPTSGSFKADIQTISYTNLSLENCSATFYGAGGIGASNNEGITICASDGTPLTSFNNYSHILSASCKLLGYNVVAGNNTIDCGNSAIYTSNFVPNSSLAWLIAAGTYHYNFCYVQDLERYLGLYSSSGDLSVAVTTQGLSAFNYLVGGGGSVLRIYRGTAADVYDHYVDIHVCGIGTQTIDDGYFVNGRQWLTRTAGPVDVFTAINGLELSFINSNGTNSPNKNLATILAPSLPPATLPSLGNYTVGDTVRLPVTHPNTQYEYVWDGTIWAVKGIATTAASSVTVPASGVALPAATVKGMYLVSGGVLTVIGITRGGVATNTTVSLTGAIIPANPGDTIALTYSTAPAAIEFMPL
ncbi:MAG: hypothetical protein ACYC43_07600, partial [Burkholderiales bacterium]